ncbi:PREDICTED: speckle targeted PIP5K1A-regulated poly(A) polymerase-like [Branchiostoma belcheri]|uniref:Speckle targeted PIP5K1A-regulated poly(A) polymerase-like n=1 Tax=Branchiostoma belcheri TaxID=7741 RepID=A0A6P4YL59_BRABE|nr:PREDICTED: speckle targeted PIP5K1A-regulated poly(A) polymerase-like [Branchiostoma belcheri]
MASGAGPSHKPRHVCELCDVRVESAATLQAHYSGKRHQKLVSLQQGRQNQADRSLFITGFRKGTSELELTDYFNSYGSVSNVFMDKDKGAYAIVEFSTKDRAQTVLQTSPHILDDHELTVKPRELKTFSPKRQHKRQAGTGDGQASEQEEVFRALCGQPSVDDQMSMLMQYHQISPEGVRVRYLVCTLLREVFQEFFPACRVFPFGSSVNGFGRPGCDLDLYLDFGRSKFDYQFATPSSADHELDSDNVISMEDIESASVEELLALLANILKRCAPGCAKVQVVPSSRCPVVKFVHKDTGLRCDISINNRLALHNTELLHLYRTVYPGLTRLVCVVREWARLGGIGGNSAGGGPRLTNYALTWMVVYYLQTEAVLPSVQQLRDVCDPTEVLLVDGWDCSFTRQIDKFPTKGKTPSPVELLKGFFHFFSKFEFETSVVSPLSGQHLSITQVSTNQIIPTAGVQGESQALQATNQASTSQHASEEVTANEGSDSCHQFKIGPINFQDPFELSHNVAGNVNEKTAQRIAEEFNKAAEICSKQNFGTKMSYLPDSVPWGVAKLLKNAAKPRQHSKKQCLHQTPTASPKPLSPEPGIPNESPDLKQRDYVIPIQMKMSKLPPHFVTAFSNSDELKQTWCEKVENFVGELFTRVLKMEEQSKVAKTEDIQESSEDVTRSPHSDVRLKNVEQSDISSRKRGHSPEVHGTKLKVKRVEHSEDPEVKSCQGHSFSHATGTQQGIGRSHELLKSCAEKPNSSSGTKLKVKRVECPEDPEVKSCQGHSFSHATGTQQKPNSSSKDTDVLAESPCHNIEKTPDDITKVDEDNAIQDEQLKSITAPHGQGTSHENGSKRHLLVSYVTKHRVWVGRRKVRRQLAKDTIPGLSLEEQVTNQIIEEDPVGGAELVFQVQSGRKFDVKSTAVELRLSAWRGDREFRDLFHFLELFLVKMVENHLME